MPKSQTRTYRQTAVGEPGPVLAFRENDDDNCIFYVTSHSIVWLGNKCLHVCTRERIMVMGV